MIKFLPTDFGHPHLLIQIFHLHGQCVLIEDTELDHPSQHVKIFIFLGSTVESILWVDDQMFLELVTRPLQQSVVLGLALTVKSVKLLATKAIRSVDIKS